jgi:ParB-like chromosome segregation protein Spo0J
MRIEIEKIRVASRIRKEVNKVEELAANIYEHGLIAPA